MRALLHASLLSASVVGCTPLTAAGERVRVVERPESVRGCQYLGPVEGSGRNNKPGEYVGGNALIAQTSAENDARNKAASLGADTLLDLETEQGFFSAEAKAGAYRCKGGAPEAKPVQTPAKAKARATPAKRQCLEVGQQCGTTSDVCCTGLKCVSRRGPDAECESAQPPEAEAETEVSAEPERAPDASEDPGP